MLTSREIYRVNRDAVVQIEAGDEFGNGFLVSGDGIIFTANHVVATRESKYSQYATAIKVYVFSNGSVKEYDATPIEAKISLDQTNFDYARLKIAISNATHVTLGSWNETDVGDPITIIPSFPNTGTILLEGIASGKSLVNTDMGSKPVKMDFFQCPVRSGFSGSPLFDVKGKVIGIVNTKVFGISQSLDKDRQLWIAAQKSGASVSFSGNNMGANMLDLINNLDQNLISGLGSSVSIEYAEKAQGTPK